MTKEEVKKAAEIMLAFADDAEIQYSHKGQNNWLNWINESSPSFDWQTFDYRIKPEPKYRPFRTREECWDEMLKHQPFGWFRSKNNKNLFNIVCINDEYIKIVNTLTKYTDTYSDAFANIEFVDGTPFGIKEE